MAKSSYTNGNRVWPNIDVHSYIRHKIIRHAIYEQCEVLGAGGALIKLGRMDLGMLGSIFFLLDF